MLLLSIDGACRRNGKPDCTAAGGLFAYRPDLDFCEVLSVYEYQSTNQRGELLALLKALDYVHAANDDEVYIVTDSEYLFNAMTKHWYTNWHAKGWVTASGDPVKNKDIWMEVTMAMRRITTDIVFYHIKGHCIPFGRVTADNLLSRDPSGRELLEQIRIKFDDCAPTKTTVFQAAQELSERNNGFRLPDDIFKTFVVINTLADAVATKVVDKADNSRKR